MENETTVTLAVVMWGIVALIVYFLLAGLIIALTWNGVNDVIAPGADLTYGQGVLMALLVSCLGGLWRPSFRSKS